MPLPPGGPLVEPVGELSGDSGTGDADPTSQQHGRLRPRPGRPSPHTPMLTEASLAEQAHCRPWPLWVPTSRKNYVVSRAGQKIAELIIEPTISSVSTGPILVFLPLSV